MPTFIYNPGVQVYIETTDKNTGKTRILDVTNDLIAGNLTRRVDAPSSFSFQLQNPGRKYDYPHPIFTPQDRIIVNMKRVKWVRVFTGYLTQVPVFSVWPRDISLTATCSLKRLQYWYWDPHLSETFNLVNKAVAGGKGSPDADGGIKGVFMAVLDQVVGWPKDKIHVGAIPADWFKLATLVAKDVEADTEAAIAEAMAATGSNPTVAGQSGSTGLVSAQNVIDGIPIPATAGRVSTFGGSNDSTTKGRNMADGEAIDSAPPYFCAMRWQYTTLDGTIKLTNSSFFYGDGKTTQKRVVVTNPANGKVCVVRAADWGPGSGGAAKYATADTRALDLDEATFSYLGLATDDVVQIGWAQDQKHALGPVLGTSPDAVDSGTNPARQEAGAATGAQLVQQGIDLAQRDRVPYTQKYGGTHMDILTDKDPVGLDCSSFVQWCYVQTTGSLQPPGVSGQLPRTVATQVPWAIQTNKAVKLTAEEALKIPGAIMVVPYHHTEMSVGNGRDTVGAHHTGTYVSVQTGSAKRWGFGYLLPGINYTDANGNYITGSTVGQTPYENGASTNTTTNNDPNAIAITNSANGTSEIDKLFKDVAWVTTPGDLSGELYTHEKAIQNDEPVFSYLNNIINSAMRSWCSAPNGDIMAWFPDYFGVWGTAATMTIEDIELKDFSVVWSDEAMITHQFVTGTIASSVSSDTGTLQNLQNNPDFISRGIASIEIGPIVSALFGIKPTAADESAFKDFVLKRYGARPKHDTLAGIQGPKAEFFMALFLFMKQWASQYQADVPMTFMPELWPGMIIRLPSYKFQAYVQEVSHTFKFGKGGGFETHATIIAPTKIGNNPIFFGLPKAPEFISGRGYTDKDHDRDVLNTLSPQQRRQAQLSGDFS